MKENSSAPFWAGPAQSIGTSPPNHGIELTGMLPTL
jgi:hypothetical protein